MMGNKTKNVQFRESVNNVLSRYTCAYVHTVEKLYARRKKKPQAHAALIHPPPMSASDNETIRSAALHLHNRLWGIRPDKKYSPSPLPVSISRQDLTTIAQGQYMVAEKNHGERRTLFFGLAEHEGQYVEYVYLLDRALHTQPVRCVTNTECLVDVCGKHPRGGLDPFAGTMLDGELIQTSQGGTNTFSYVVFDAMFVCGYDVRKKDFPTRMKEAAKFLRIVQQGSVLFDQNGASAPIHFNTKTWYPVGHADTSFPSLLAQEHQDGLVFMPREDPLVVGRNPRIFKWKPKHECTIDVLWKDGRVSVGRGADLVPFEPPWLDVLRQEMQDKESGVYELNPVFGADGENLTHFAVLHRRHDKTTPNQHRTVESTIHNIQEGIDVELLTTVLGGGVKEMKKLDGQ